jgi:predicted GNAT family acetyltransferase
MPITTELITKRNFSEYKSKLTTMFTDMVKEQDSYLDKVNKDNIDLKDIYVKLDEILTSSFQCYLIKESDEVVGYMTISKTKKSDVISIRDIFIQKSSRNKGTTGIILEEFFKKAKEEKFKAIEICMNSQDRTRYKLLKKYEFESYRSCMFRKL